MKGYSLKRRQFLRAIGIASFAEALLGKAEPAFAQTWQKLGPAITLYRARIPRDRRFSPMPIASGHNDRLILSSNGIVFGDGYDGYGELGSGNTTAKSSFIQVTGISNAVSVACGYGHSAFLRADGLVLTSGSNDRGQLGNNSAPHSKTLVQTIGVSNVTRISCGYYTTTALRSDGFIFGCGTNSSGELGIGNTISKSTFVQAIGISNVTSSQTFIQAIGISNVVAIAAGRQNIVALRSDGMVFASGKDPVSGAWVNGTSQKPS